ncbi:MAG TPA: hypothetical protein VMX17_13200 [Candidatus Glassbacteria bacterium]|nr:hypothetical protein [Candidatus Glassbacteria bacterium]
MRIPQIVMIILFAMAFAVSAIKHGDKKEKPFDEYNIWITLLRITAFGLLLCWGGFW